MPSASAARAHGLITGFESAAGGAVSAANCSTAATIAAASVSATPRGSSTRIAVTIPRPARRLGDVPRVPVIDADAVFEAVSPEAAVARTRDAFERHHAGDWVMPAKVYVDAPPAGDFRAMPARGDGLAILKWVTSFPANPARGLPVVAGALLASSAETGELRAIVDCAAVTSLRTGAAAAVSATALAREGAEGTGIVGCGVNGAWSARCLAAAGYDRGVVHDREEAAAQALASELGWRAGTREEAAAQDVVVTVTPGIEPVITSSDLRPGQHIAALGADARGKAEVERDALLRCSLFCDEWDQASRGGELSGPASDGQVDRERVAELGAVLAGEAPGRTSADDVTLFDSTGLAIQDLGIVLAVLEALERGEIAPASAPI